MSIHSGRYGAVLRMLPKADGTFDDIYSRDDGSTQDTTYKDALGTTQSYGGFRQNVVQSKDVESKYLTGRKTLEAPAASMLDAGTVLKEAKNAAARTTMNPTVSAVTSWTLENAMQSIQYVASNTRGYRGRLEGTHNASGNITGIGAIPPIAPGQRFRFYGFTGSDSGLIDDYKGTVYRVTAVANSVQIQINYQLTNPITWTIGWMSDWKCPGDELWCNRLECSFTDETNHIDEKMIGFADYTSPSCSSLMPSTTKNLEIEGIDNPLCLLDANIQFTTDVSQFTDSCSAKVGGWQSCVVGPTDCTISTNIHGDNYGELYTQKAVGEYYHDVNGDPRKWEDLSIVEKQRKFWPGSNHAVRLYVGNNGAYWEFYKMMFGTFGGLNVDTTSNNPLQFSCNMEFNAYPQGRKGCEPGFIRYYSGDGDFDHAEEFSYLVDLRMDGDDEKETKDYNGQGEMVYYEDNDDKDYPCNDDETSCKEVRDSNDALKNETYYKKF